MPVISNTMAVIGQIFNSPHKDSIVTLRLSPTQVAGMSDLPEKTQQLPLSPGFKMVFIAVFSLTVLAGIAEIVFAFSWATPTPNQQNVFEGMGFTWKAGTGAILGLLGGKMT